VGLDKQPSGEMKKEAAPEAAFSLFLAGRRRLRRALPELAVGFSRHPGKQACGPCNRPELGLLLIDTIPLCQYIARLRLLSPPLSANTRTSRVPNLQTSPTHLP
jgi:hypothetical protein